MIDATAILKQHVGLAPESIGKSVIDMAIRRRMVATGSSSTDQYFARLATNQAEVSELTEEIVVPETWFFRYAESFRYLARQLSGRRKVRILCVPCSTGEEPYSVAMTLLDAGRLPESFQIQAADISQRAVNSARIGVYTQNAFRSIDKPTRDRYFKTTSKGSELQDDVRRLVKFRVANLIEPGFLAGEAPYDAIFCRNLLIYLTPDARRKVIDTLDRLLLPDGVVYLGHAEPLGMMDSRFRACGPPHAFAFTRITGSVATSTTPSISPPQRTANVSRPGIPQRPTPELPPDVSTHLDGLAAKEMLVANSPDPLSDARLTADRGDVEAALALVERYVSEHPPSAEAYALIGSLHTTAGKLAAAETAFTRALYIDPNHYESLIHLMILADNRGDGTAASNYRRRAARQEGTR